MSVFFIVNFCHNSQFTFPYRICWLYRFNASQNTSKRNSFVNYTIRSGSFKTELIHSMKITSTKMYSNKISLNTVFTRSYLLQHSIVWFKKNKTNIVFPRSATCCCMWIHTTDWMYRTKTKHLLSAVNVIKHCYGNCQMCLTKIGVVRFQDILFQSWWFFQIHLNTPHHTIRLHTHFMSKSEWKHHPLKIVECFVIIFALNTHTNIHIHKKRSQKKSMNCTHINLIWFCIIKQNTFRVW